MQTGQGDLGGRHHPAIIFRIVIQVVAEFGQLPRLEHGLLFDHEGSIFLRITLADMQVQHPGDQCPLQARPAPLST